MFMHYSRVVSVVLVLSEVGPVLKSRYGTELSEVWDVGSVQDFILLYLRLVWIKRNGRQGELKITNIMLERFSADLRPAISYWRVGYKILAYNATSVGAGRRNRCYYQYHCVYCSGDGVKIVTWTGPINVNMRFQTFYILSFLSCFATQNYVQIHM